MTLSVFDFARHTTHAAHGLDIEAQRFEPGHFVGSAGVHAHRFYELVFFDGGNGVHRIADGERPIAAGSVDAIREGRSHRLDLPPGTHGWMLVFTEEACARTGVPLRSMSWFGEEPGGRVEFSKPRLRALRSAFVALEDNQTTATAETGLVAGRLFARIVAAVADASALMHPRARDRRMFERLAEVIDDRYLDPPTLSQLADALGLTASYLTTRIREETGRTAMQWLMVRRMREARRRLLAEDASITRVAHELAFEDSSHFTRCFRAAHGVTPAAWRRRSQ